uniref:F-box domain-containing protein n=2 Tax=Graphocephala atropunctata TaxID=36148 RepID=A0A1B6KMT1_9HEMI
MNMSKNWRQSRILSSQHRPANDGEEVPVRKTSMLVCLPPEILVVIAKYLSVKDLLSCSVSCVRLRAVFNDDFIWRRFCKPNIIKYINSTKQNNDVDYNISSLTEDLDPMCNQRINYIQQNQLLLNWKNGKFVEHRVYSASGLYYMCLKSGTAIIYEDIYLFLYDYYAHSIVVWNIEDVPFRYTDIRLLYQNFFYEGLHYEVVGRKLVVFEVGKLIQIYDINLPDKTLPLVSLMLVDQEVPLDKIPGFNSPEDVYAICYHRVIENNIYSYKVGKPILHIWDIEKGTKVRALMPPKEGINFYVLAAANNGNDLVLCLEINDSQRRFNALGKVYEVLTYSFSRDFFKTVWTNKEGSSSVYIPFHAVYHEHFVILFCHLNSYFIEDTSLSKTILVLYDYKWGVIIGEKSFPELVCHRQTKVVNNQLLLATAFCLYGLDLYTLDIVYSFKFDNGKIELLNVFDGNFIVTTPKSLLRVSKTKLKEVWDVKNRRRCMYMTYVFTSAYTNDSVFVNQSFTKMIVVGKGTLGVLNFW